MSQIINHSQLFTPASQQCDEAYQIGRFDIKITNNVKEKVVQKVEPDNQQIALEIQENE